MKDLITKSPSAPQLSTSSGGRELKDFDGFRRESVELSASSGGRELKEHKHFSEPHEFGRPLREVVN